MPWVHQGNGAIAIGQPLAGPHDLQRLAPVLDLLDITGETEAAFMVRAVDGNIAIVQDISGGALSVARKLYASKR